MITDNEFPVFTDVFSNLADMTIASKVYSPVFSYGNKTDLLKFLKLKRREGTNIYPLVWLITPFSVSGDTHPEAPITIVMATLSNKDMSNKERTTTTFEQVLDPLFVDVVRQLMRHGKTKLVKLSSSTQTRYFNYETEEEIEGTDVWDAISFSGFVQFNHKCNN